MALRIRELWQRWQKDFWRVFRFGITGTLCSLIHYGVYCLCLLFTNTTLACAAGYCVGIVCNSGLCRQSCRQLPVGNLSAPPLPVDGCQQVAVAGPRDGSRRACQLPSAPVRLRQEQSIRPEFRRNRIGIMCQSYGNPMGNERIWNKKCSFAALRQVCTGHHLPAMSVRFVTGQCCL